VFERWLKDHPALKEVPNNIKVLLLAVKTRLRQKRRERRADKAQAAPAAVAPVALPTSPLAATRRVGAGLTRLEEAIDDCLAVARQMDREGLAGVIELLRSARNQVVRQAGS
jgi:hypothetical protein